ncbi:type III-A CRISPR-associated protein Cas10/Csm1 [Dolosicoccus paucivorans]|uniref:CRISPR system single-strand-specific deoxyribonuclease Cas10/Csm1 (subtype III-A) n=1 Tax=Dolosicoccus paucivorans TaxID=84521 RepID=A0A1G8JUU2_9LACT|nr:type III-A CRISPR-associated protein Cas10/Csm1 [Dolosicoccus paucivorans]PMB85057.1 type III-A CRISPR-associated protein Cas10/Csm1 [Dolosicoccus paucivorans]PMC58987.1 type III-A CRISPR-associated protein Cas10/Csm1 [Dolosicoccus paucivorans]SDI34853.1 CRISPR-associated protein Cas10/Csm1, subtype III-A/MTUBE [Dolosicoccus paucivorans]
MSEQTRNDLVMSALLYNIGKVVQYAKDSSGDSFELGYELLSSLNAPQDILEPLKYHDKNEIEKQQLSPNHLAYVIDYANRLANETVKKPSNGKVKAQKTDWTNQADIFNDFGKRTGHRFYQPLTFDDRHYFHFASESQRPYQPESYQRILDQLKEELALMEFCFSYEAKVLNMLERLLSFVPSDMDSLAAHDISLYDHSKITTAIATCVFDYLMDQEKNFNHLLNSLAFNNEPAFLLLTYDVSGIQDFIYTIRDNKAAKMLRSRSFYLEMIAENVNYQLLNCLKLSRANLLYSGGGGAYLLIPNTARSREVVAQVQKEINAFLRHTYGSGLFIAFSHQAFSAYDMLEDMGSVYQKVGHKISEQKLNRYSATELLELNTLGKKTGRECNVCHRIYNHPTSERCAICEGLVNFSNDLQNQGFFEVSSNQRGLPLGFGDYLIPISEQDLLKGKVEGRIYSKNKFYVSDYPATHLWIGDYTDKEAPTFNDYLKDNAGIRRLGVVRCDVDDLGSAFIAGFSKEYQSFTRTATLSRSLALFFQYYINEILRECNTTGSIIYAGGDDVFVVGHWLDMIEFAIKLRQSFIQYTQGKLTLSTGVGLFPGKTPISIMAQQTGDLESSAKGAFSDKDAITLFHPDYTFKWNHFIEHIWCDKYPLIASFFDQSSMDRTYGKAFLYRLLDLIRSSFVEAQGSSRGQFKTISWARWVYYLSQMEPKGEKEKEHFKKFAQKLHQYFEDEQEAKELELAIMLYIYTIREDI